MKSRKLNNFKHQEAEYISLIVKVVSILFLITQFYIIYANRSIINAKSIGWSLFKPNFVISLWSSILYFGVMLLYLAIYSYTLNKIAVQIKSNLLKNYMFFNLGLLLLLLSFILALTNVSFEIRNIIGLLFLGILGYGVLGIIFTLVIAASSSIKKNSSNLSKYFISSPILSGSGYLILTLILVIALEINVFLGFGLIILINYFLIRKMTIFPKIFDDILTDLDIQLINRNINHEPFPSAKV